MNTTFEHFVITRFNLKQSIWKADKKGGTVNDLNWLEDRYHIFNTYCFPSMVKQVNQNFKWLVYFDSKTPETFNHINSDLQQKLKNFIPIYVSSFQQFELQLSKDIKENTDKSVEYIITTRLDNDDCFHKDAIQIIQQNFKPIDLTIVDLRNGLTLQIVEGFKLGLKKNIISGPFISLIENNKNQYLTVYDREHTAWNEQDKFIPVSSGFYWLQIIHERNISNTLTNQLTYNKSYLEGFEFLPKFNFKFDYYIFIIQRRIFKILKKLLKIK